MLIKLKKLIKKIIFGYKADNESYLAFLKKKGVRLGKNIKIYSPNRTNIDLLNPHLLEFGSNIQMTGPVTILTHDYSVYVLNNISNGRIFGKQKPVKLGNNIFIGWGATILPGTEVGDNVIIGANSVVSGILEENSVYAGNPAKKIMSIEEYRNKIENNQLKEAVRIYKSYKKTFNQEPPEEIFHEYFYLFTNFGDNINETFKKKMSDEGNYKKNEVYLKNNKALFKSYKEFCDFANSEKGD